MHFSARQDAVAVWVQKNGLVDAYLEDPRAQTLGYFRVPGYRGRSLQLDFQTIDARWCLLKCLSRRSWEVLKAIIGHLKAKV